MLIAAVAAVADWAAVKTHRRRVETAAKPLVMLALIGLVATAEATPDGTRPWILVALVCGLVGDIALLPSIDRFIVGLGSFLVGHLAYVIAFSTMWRTSWWLVVGGAGAIGLLATFGRPIVASLRDSPLRWPVVAYIAVTCLVIVTGAGTGRAVIALGALAFALSDGLLGWNRFVSPVPDRRVWVHVLYHLGQAAIVVGVLDAAPGT